MSVTSIREIMNSMAYGPAPEGAEQALAWIAQHGGIFGHFIGGGFVSSAEGERFAVANPATGAPLAQVALGTGADIDRAVRAARDAFPAWAALSGAQRARHLYALARHLQKNARLFAVIETLDNGKPIRESRDIDVPLAVRHFYHHAGWPPLLAERFPGHRPLGVCGQIIPWNFPLLMLAWKIAPALAAGNTLVLKPAEYTPLSALLFAEICVAAGLPAGVVNIVCGDGTTGAALVAHPDVDKIAFTGSTDVGRLIRAQTAGSGKRLSLELGGKSPFLVFDDADLDSAVEGAVDAIWFNQGQVCCAGSRLLVQEGVAERLHAKLRARMMTLTVGDPLDKCTDIGAIVAPVQLERIQTLVARGCAEGARLWQPPCTLPEAGCFYPPTLLLDVAPASIVATEEIFGPVLVSMTFRTPEEAVMLANNSRYGLAASVWSESVGLCLAVARELQAGVVWINGTNLFDAASGFGGYRESGFGREGGAEGLKEYLRPPAEGDGPAARPPPAPPAPEEAQIPVPAATGIDRTAKLWIGGRQVRPDSGYSMPARDARGRLAGEVGRGNRKDIRNAVEAAHRAGAWSRATAHARAQVLFYIAENLAVRGAEFSARLAGLCGVAEEAAREEVAASLDRLFYYAGQADKFDGAVHAVDGRHVVLALHEPWGVMGVVCPEEAPLLSFVSLVAPALAMGNRVVAVPSPSCPLIATDFYQVLETSDLPAGALNIVTGPRDELAGVLAAHDDLAAIWYFGPVEGCAMVERLAAGNLKASWTSLGRSRNWASAESGQGESFLDRATQVKNVWLPYAS
ncbi:MAG: aldehyde dehydrogenase family protein [Acetobacteraceae bacterium]